MEEWLYKQILDGFWFYHKVSDNHEMLHFAMNFFSKKSQLLVMMLNKLQKTNRNQFVNEEYPIAIYWKKERKL